MVDAGAFRSDLFNRRNVFPIELPPLRERRADIAVLVRHPVASHAQRLNRPIHTIRSAVMTALTEWDWPGNFREPDTVLERAVILSDGGTLRAALPGSARRSSPALRAAYGLRVDCRALLDTLEHDHVRMHLPFG